MYSVGVSAVPSAMALSPGFRIANKKRHAEHDHRNRERAEERGMDDAVDGPKDEGQTANDREDLGRFGAQHRPKGLGRTRGPAVTERKPEHDGEYHARNEAHRAAQQRRPRARPAGPCSRDSGDDKRGDRLPAVDCAERTGSDEGDHEAAGFGYLKSCPLRAPGKAGANLAIITGRTLAQQ